MGDALEVTGSFKIRKIESKEDSIEYGKDRGWCTADPESTDYENSYSLERGNLFIIYEKDKEKPEAQLFISKNGSVEIKKKYNQSCKLDTFTKDEKFNEWFESNYKNITEKEYKKPSLPLLNEQNFNYLSIVSYENSGPQLLTIKMIIDHPPIHIENESELNTSDITRGNVVILADREVLLFNGLDWNRFQLYSLTTSMNNIRGFELDMQLIFEGDYSILNGITNNNSIISCSVNQQRTPIYGGF